MLLILRYRISRITLLYAGMSYFEYNSKPDYNYTRLNRKLN